MLDYWENNRPKSKESNFKYTNNFKMNSRILYFT